MFVCSYRRCWVENVLPKKRKFWRGGGVHDYGILRAWGGNAFWNFRRQAGVKTWKPSVVRYGYFLELPNTLKRWMILVPCTYSESLGVKPPARDPQSLFDLGFWFLGFGIWYLLLGEFTLHKTVNRWISCSVHTVRADTALMKSSWSISAMVSRTWRMLCCWEDVFE